MSRKFLAKLGIICGLLFVLSYMPAEASKTSQSILGDGDVFPHFCVDFSGTWRTDDGNFYRVTQSQCQHIRIELLSGNDRDDLVDLVPDNRVYEIDGCSFKGITQHRWNSLDFGTSVRTWSRFTYSDRAHVS